MSAGVVEVRESDLALSYARSRLADLDRMRQVLQAAQAGMAQRDIARAAHLSQPTVHRMIGRARVLGLDNETVEEIVLRRFVGELTDSEMLHQLQAFSRWIPSITDPIDGRLPEDSEAELEALVTEGFLSDGELTRVVAAHA
ncbi:MAG: hypothetical protein LBH48_07725 [Bifidobacteriaceae bacterium]|nr:hypothetical protein [Bifidobacteriaceae bacterium]